VAQHAEALMLFGQFVGAWDLEITLYDLDGNVRADSSPPNAATSGSRGSKRASKTSAPNKPNSPPRRRTRPDRRRRRPISPP